MRYRDINISSDLIFWKTPYSYMNQYIKSYLCQKSTINQKMLFTNIKWNENSRIQRLGLYQLSVQKKNKTSKNSKCLQKAKVFCMIIKNLI